MARATLPWGVGFLSLFRVLNIAREPWRVSGILRDPSQGLSMKVKRCQPPNISEEGTGWGGPVPVCGRWRRQKRKQRPHRLFLGPPVLVCPHPFHGCLFFGSSSQVCLKTHRVLHVAGNKCCWRSSVWAGVGSVCVSVCVVGG